VVLFDGSAGSAVVGLRCGVMEHRGVAADSVAGVRECAGYSGSGMKKRGELQHVASKGNTTGCMVGTWSSSDKWRRQRRRAGAVGTARLEQRRLYTLLCGAQSEDTGVV
jgi:hypothetical protein